VGKGWLPHEAENLTTIFELIAQKIVRASLSRNPMGLYDQLQG
jgi:hypothetical protein